MVPPAVPPIALAKVLDESPEHLTELFPGRQAISQFIGRDVLLGICVFQVREYFCQRALRVRQEARERPVGALFEAFRHVRRNGTIGSRDLLVEVAIFAKPRFLEQRVYCAAELH